MRDKLFSLNNLLFLFFILVLLNILIFFQFKGIIYSDEGYILNSALRVVHGQVPYRDFDVTYTPLSFLITSVFLHTFGESVFSGRLASLAISLLSLFALYKIVRLITKKVPLVLLSLLFFIAWGPAHINFPWPTMFAVCFYLYTIFFYLLGIIRQKGVYFFMSGIMVILIFLSKQNFGIGLFLVSFLPFLFFKKKIYVFYFLFGLLTSGIVITGILLFTSSFMPFIKDMYIYTFERILFGKTLDTQFIYQGSFIIKILKFILYTSPLTLSVISFFICLKSNKNLLIVPLFTATFYLLGIRPTTDYDHFVPLLAISCLPLAIIISNNKSELNKKFFLLILIFITGLGLYSAYFYGYYRWNPPMQYDTTFAQDPRLHVFLSNQEIERTMQITKYIQTKTKPNDFIYIYQYVPLVYFLADRINATRSDLISPIEVETNYQKNIINSLTKKKVPMIILGKTNSQDLSPIVQFIKNHYSQSKNIGNYTIFTK